MSWLHNKLFWTVLIFLSAAAFRLTSMDLIEFKLDEARDVYEMGKFWTHPSFIIELGTIQSTGVYNPPLWYYFLAVISLPLRDPQYLSFMIALFNCMAVAGFYLVVKKFYGSRIEYGMTPEIAGLLLAFSPWNILFSRKIWAPDMILVLAVPLFYFLHVVFQGRTLDKARPLQKWAWFFIAMLLSLLSQLHASGIFLSLGVLITIIMVITVIKVIPVQINWKFAILGFLVSLIPMLPYIFYQINTGCGDCRAFSTYQQGGSLIVPGFDGNAFLRPFEFIGASSFGNALGIKVYRAFVEGYPFVGFLSSIFFLSFLLMPIGIIYIVRKKRELLFLPCILIFVAALYFATQTPAHLYYYLIVSPISILIYCLGIVSLGKASKAFPIIVITVIIVINIIFEFSLYQFLSTTKIIPGDYGPVYSVTKEQAEDRGMNVEEYTISLYQQP